MSPGTTWTVRPLMDEEAITLEVTQMDYSLQIHSGKKKLTFLSHVRWPDKANGPFFRNNNAPGHPHFVCVLLQEGMVTSQNTR